MARGEIPKTPFEVQRRALGFRGFQLVQMIELWNAQRGMSPSYNEVMAELGLDSRGHVANIAKRAERAGYVKREGSGKDRRLRLA